ncbi:tyrosine--tRNA ligase [Candidatus Micrarchaeota archaeon]|nr:tyrosine--tRNA ligase [Candidatus Micrarchaeota archaeon]
MDIESKIDLVKREPMQEIVTDEDLKQVFENYSNPKHYIGFEISGKVHLGSGLLTALKIQDFLKAGVKPIIVLADYHTWLNKKMGDDLDLIRDIAGNYFKHAFISMGLTEDKVEYILLSDIYDKDYWETVIQISKNTSIKRMLRCTTVMGRKEGEGNDCSFIMYPAMQAADIFKLDVQFAHAGMDQRNVHMLAREVAPKINKQKPVALHHKILFGLQGPGTRMEQYVTATDKAKILEGQIDMKMSKSKPDTCIFVHDSPEEIKRKIKKAYAPEKITENNPIFQYAEMAVIREGKFKIERPEKFGGDLEIGSAEELKKMYESAELFPLDLKNAVADWLIKTLEPSRTYFEKKENQKYIDQIQKIIETR